MEENRGVTGKGFKVIAPEMLTLPHDPLGEKQGRRRSTKLALIKQTEGRGKHTKRRKEVVCPLENLALRRGNI